VWSKTISLDRFAGRLFVRSSSLEIDLNDFGVAITPLTFEQIDTFSCRQIDYGIWLSGRSVGIRFGKCAPSQENQRDESGRGREPQTPH
jgi:hypothetical protein